ncbi:hypothetical protein GCM10022395_16720 [Snuella lapsa]|uniref:Uncharacterized protein n=1 Tax=Snuella lapsa TaxID=870481 RepID=A0ABP6XLS2_9FLAO
MYDMEPLELKHSYPISSAIISMMLGLLLSDWQEQKKTIRIKRIDKKRFIVTSRNLEKVCHLYVKLNINKD